ncbi:hypothetical protein D9M71_722200 [compost metagenome]
MQHGADHRDGEHALQVTVAVPVHHRHGVTGLDPGLGEDVGQARHALVEGGVAVADAVAVDDLAGLLVTAAGHQQALYQQGIDVGVVGGLDDAGLEHGAHLVRLEKLIVDPDFRPLLPCANQSKE